LLSTRREDKHLNNDYLYAIGVYFVEKIEFEPLFQKFSRNLLLYKSDFIAGLMNADSDSEIEIEKVVCNLFDPFTHSLINTPVRGNKCLHGQCFDLRTFLALMYATKVRQWKCPICSK
jgi:hypothetical protein